jgi:hypothetical protein
VKIENVVVVRVDEYRDGKRIRGRRQHLKVGDRVPDGAVVVGFQTNIELAESDKAHEVPTG